MAEPIYREHPPESAALACAGAHLQGTAVRSMEVYADFSHAASGMSKPCTQDASAGH